MIGPGRPQAFGAPGGRAVPRVMTVSVIITTRDRATDLQRTCDVVLQLRLVVGHWGTQLVVSGTGWNSVLSSKAHACFMGRLQTLACTALKHEVDLL
jgi:hypothetical protein